MNCPSTLSLANNGMTTSQLDPALAVISRDSPAATPRSTAGPWLFSPWLDAFLVANRRLAAALALANGDGFQRPRRPAILANLLRHHAASLDHAGPGLSRPRPFGQTKIGFPRTGRRRRSSPAAASISPPARSPAFCRSTTSGTPGTSPPSITASIASTTAACPHASLRGLANRKMGPSPFSPLCHPSRCRRDLDLHELESTLQTVDWLAVAAPAWLFFREAMETAARCRAHFI